MARSIAEIRSRFISQLRKQIATAENLRQAQQNQQQPSQHMIDKNGWNGSVFDYAGMAKPFDRREMTADAVSAITGATPGVVGDLEVSSLQGDYLSVQERAFRLRHATPIRRQMHSAARRYGHGHAAGLFSRGVLGYLEQLLKHSKDAPR